MKTCRLVSEFEALKWPVSWKIRAGNTQLQTVAVQNNFVMEGVETHESGVRGQFTKADGAGN